MFLSTLNRVKRRLQFTGWLQYIPTGLITLVFLLAAALARLFGHLAFAIPIAVIGSLLLAALVFDLITVKLRLRPSEGLPERKDDLGLFDLVRARRSCRSFQTRKLTSADHKELMEYVHCHSQAPKIGTAPIRFEYVSAPLTVWPVVNATEFLVAIAPSKYNRLAVIDVGRTLEKIVLDATRMGLGTCWIGPGADHASIERHLGERFNPEKDHIICVCAVGYWSRYWPLFLRFVQLQFHRRLPLSSLFFADASFQKPLDVSAHPFERFGRCYEACQWSPSSYNGQTTRCVAVLDSESEINGRQHTGKSCLARFDFYAAAESSYYAPVALGIWCAHWELGCETLGIRGHFEVLPGGKEKVAGSQLPRYDMSWVLDENL